MIFAINLTQCIRQNDGYAEAELFVVFAHEKKTNEKHTTAGSNSHTLEIRLMEREKISWW